MAAPGSARPCPLHPRGSSGPEPQRAKGKEQSPDVNYWKRIKSVSPERERTGPAHRQPAQRPLPRPPPAPRSSARGTRRAGPEGSGARRGRPAPSPPDAEVVSARLSPRRCAGKHRGAAAESGRDAPRTARPQPSATAARRGGGAGRAGDVEKRRRPRAWENGPGKLPRSDRGNRASSDGGRCRDPALPPATRDRSEGAVLDEPPCPEAGHPAPRPAPARPHPRPRLTSVRRSARPGPFPGCRHRPAGRGGGEEGAGPRGPRERGRRRRVTDRPRSAGAGLGPGG